MAKLLTFIISKIESIISKAKINADKGVHIKGKVFIHPTARIETRYGGSITIGENTKIWDHVLIYSYGGDIVIGENNDINPYTIIYGHGGTRIGDNVLIAGHCMIIPNNHNYKRLDVDINKQGSIKKGIIIEDNVWIAHSCSILDNVRISSGTIVAAGSVVTKSTRKNSIYGGIPARFLKGREEE